MTPMCIPTLGIALVWESQMFRTLIEKTNKHQIGPLRGYIKRSVRGEMRGTLKPIRER